MNYKTLCNKINKSSNFTNEEKSYLLNIIDKDTPVEVVFKCPNCHEDIDVYHQMDSYCGNCGQKFKFDRHRYEMINVLKGEEDND